MTQVSFIKYHFSSYGFHVHEFHVTSPSQSGCRWWFTLQSPRTEVRKELVDGIPRIVYHHSPSHAVLVRRAKSVVVRDGNNLPHGVAATWLDIGDCPLVQAAISRLVPDRQLDEELVLFVAGELNKEDAERSGGGGSAVSRSSADGSPPHANPVFEEEPIYCTKEGLRFKPSEISRLTALKAADQESLEQAMRETGTQIKRRRKNHARSV